MGVLEETADDLSGLLARGLSEAEAARRLGIRGPVEPPATSRSMASIIRANVFTVFNLILVAFGVLTLLFGHFEDALFIAILVGNAGIGILQEWRAKRSLDRLAALVAPHATVIRDGLERQVSVNELVVDDLVLINQGDQLVADGEVSRSNGLWLDESILTGEAQAVYRRVGDEVRSGSFAVEGSGTYVITAVGPESYAERVADVARKFRHPRSPLELDMNRLLIVLVGVMVPVGGILGYALFERDAGVSEAVTTSVAAVVTLIPEGLILLMSLTYAFAALRMTRRGALAQQLNAVESLASVDVICLDKTGTLTESSLRVVDYLPVDSMDRDFLVKCLRRYAASQPDRNPTLEAIAESLPGDFEESSGHVPFLSSRRWSGLRIGALGLVLGAPEHFELGELTKRVALEQDQGRRVVALGTTAARLDQPFGSSSSPPGDLQALGVVVLAERLRPDASETVEFFQKQNVQLKVISGDAPRTVAAIAKDAGIPAIHVLDGRELPNDPHELRRAVQSASVIGRISPEGKKRVVEALCDSGRYVAMVGDGVNDVPALKASRLAIAPGSGTQMAKSVADLVLVRGDFSAVPAMVAEGRKILRNLHRVAKLFVTKSVFAAFVVLTLGISPQSFPVLPRHLTLVATLAIGFPAFFLALAPSSGTWQEKGFLRGISRFAIPAGTAAGLGVVSSYLFSLEVINLPLIEAQTVATTVLMIVGLYFILVLEAAGRTRGAAVTVLCAAMLAIYVLALVFPATREFFELAVPNLPIILSALGGSLLAILGLAAMDERFVPGRAFEGLGNADSD